MTKDELRQQAGYIEAYQKINNYPQGFKFTVYYSKIPTAKRRALKIVLEDAVQAGLIESRAIGIDLAMNITDETFTRL